MAISPAQLLRLCLVAPAQDMVLALGEPGCGKSTMIRWAARLMGHQYWPLWIGTKESVEFSGLPHLIEKDARTYGTWAPFEGMFPLEGESRDGWITINLDDVNHANPSVTKSAVRCIYGDGSERVMGQSRLYPNVRLFGTGNRHTDRAGASRFFTYTANRVCTVEVRPPTGREWLAASRDGQFRLPEPDPAYPALRQKIDAAVELGIPSILAAWTQCAYRERGLSTFDPTADAFLSSRSIEQLGRFERALDAAGVDGDILFECAKGTLGETAATEYWAFRKFQTELPDVDAILRGESVPLPERIEVLYMLVSLVVRQAAEKHVAAVAKLLNSLAASPVPSAIEVSAFLAFEATHGSATALRRIATERAFIEWLGKFGQHL